MSQGRALKQTVKGKLLPPRSPRTLPFGIGAGLRMQIDFQYQTRIYLGLYEVELNRHIRRLLKPGMTAFDVGAEHGYDTLVISKFTNARVATFEFDQQCLAGMRETFALNPGAADKVQVVERMVGDQEGQLGLDEYAYGPDGFVPDFLKIDIEGWEAAALGSASRILAERHPSMIVEVHSAEQERLCGEILTQNGYKPLIVNQRRVWADHRPTDEVNRWLVAGP